MRADTLAGRTLLALVAHPDDESLACGGLLARCAALNARVVVVSLTRGEAGPAPATAPTHRLTPGASLAGIRSAEFQAAARVLGAREAILLDHADGMLPWLDAAVVEAAIRGLLAAHRPDVVVTFDVDGLYWHPDHVAVHERTTAVVAALGEAAPALYYASLPRGQMRAVVERTGGDRPVVPGLTDPDAFGAAAPEPTLVVDAGPYAAHKLAALMCHASQFAASAFGALSTADAPLLAREHYRRADVGAGGPTFLDALGWPPARPHP